MNHLIASTYDPARGINLPSRRIEGGFKLSYFENYGLEILGEVDQQGFQHCKLPEGWHPVASEASPMQLLLFDDVSRLRARIFYKPAAQGGGASMQIVPVIDLFYFEHAFKKIAERPAIILGNREHG